MISAQEIGSSLVSFELIFEALQFEKFCFNFHSPSLKNPKNPGIQTFHIGKDQNVQVGGAYHRTRITKFSCNLKAVNQ